MKEYFEIKFNDKESVTFNYKEDGKCYIIVKEIDIINHEIVLPNIYVRAYLEDSLTIAKNNRKITLTMAEIDYVCDEFEVLYQLSITQK